VRESSVAWDSLVHSEQPSCETVRLESVHTTQDLSNGVMLTRLTCEVASEPLHTHLHVAAHCFMHPLFAFPDAEVGPRYHAARPPSRRGAVQIPSYGGHCGLRLYVLRT
jgi:hypothetical protein